MPLVSEVCAQKTCRFCLKEHENHFVRFAGGQEYWICEVCLDVLKNLLEDIGVNWSEL